MDTSIHATATVDAHAELEPDVVVGAGAVIGEDVRIGTGTRVGPLAVILGPTRIGRDNTIHAHACLGDAPQDLSYRGEPTRLEIGDGNHFREFVTVHRGSTKDEGVTRIGDDNLLMAYSHVGHDCRVGSGITMANCATLAGHVSVGDHANIAGLSAIHQFARVGCHAMLGGGTIAVMDIPPYTMASGNHARLYGLNRRGLRRAGMAEAVITALRRAYRLLFRSGLGRAEAIAEVRRQGWDRTPEVAHLLGFLESSRRGGDPVTAPLRAAVVGVGYLGRFHARKYAELPDVELVAVVDVDADRAAALAAELDTEALSDHRLLPGRVDVASVVTPTDAHHEVAADLLNAGIHCLVEKPLTPTVEEGRELVALARRRGVVLQVGHLERFNPVVVGARPHVDGPLFIESHRVARFRRRGTEVSVVLDLMIHDIDLILELVAAPLRRIHANGVAVLSGDIDIANARLEFDNGCVANVTASRVSLKSERMLRMFQRRSYLALDLHNGSLEIRRKGDSSLDPEIPGIDSERHSFRRGDALRAEIEALLESIRTGDPPVVSGEEGLRALSTALEVTRQVRANATAGNLREAGGWVDE